MDSISFWHWFIVGIAFVVLEMLAPGTVFLWLGIAAGLTGFVLLAMPALGWELQLALFAVLGVVSTVTGRMIWKRTETESDHPTLNRRGEQYVGRTFTLDAPIDNGFGKIVVDDSTWKIAGDDLPGGTKIRITGVDGVVLTVEKAD